jgi:hypothetical protein
VNVAEKSSRSKGSVLYFTSGAPTAEVPITSRRAARETPEASPRTRASDISCTIPAIIRLIASFTIRACSPSPT